jgi:hypothetical protein
MKPQITAVLGAFVIVGLLFLFASCGNSEAEIKAARSDAYEAGYHQGLEDSSNFYNEEDLEDAYWEGFEDGASEMLDLTGGSSSDIEYIAQGILEEARYYAAEKADITMLDAMDIVSVYLNGHDPSGYPLPTKREFEEAVDVLLRYAIFLEWNTESYSEIMEDYDPFYG